MLITRRWLDWDTGKGHYLSFLDNHDINNDKWRAGHHINGNQPQWVIIIIIIIIIIIN
jgi:hypothetical protein